MASNGIDSKRLLKDAKKLILSANDDDINKGLKHLKKVIKSDPENLWAFIFYGVGASKSEKHKHEAVPAFETAAHVNPDSIECWKGMRACLEARERSERENKLLVEAYCNLLRLENDLNKWKGLYSEITTPNSKLPVSLVATVVASLMGDFSSKSYKHQTSCKDLSDLAFNYESLLETNLADVLYAFESWANFLDFSDRPDFCKQVCAHLTKFKFFEALSIFLHHTLLVYGSKLYNKIQLMQYVIDIAFDCLDNVEKLIPFVKAPFKEIENVKSFNQIKLALCIVNYFEEDFTMIREHLELLSCSGDVSATLFLLKFLCKVKDYESVMFLCVKFAKTFAFLQNDKLKFQFILCLLEALSTSNEVTHLEYAIKIGLKTLSKYGTSCRLYYYLSHSYLGLQSSTAFFFLEKPILWYSDEAKYLTCLLKQDVSDCSNLDSDKWLPTALLTANYDLINNNVKRALKNFTKVGAKDRVIAEPFHILGVDFLNKGNVAKAVSCFQRAFSLRPLDEVSLKHYLNSLFKQDDEERALQVLDSVWSGHFGKWHPIGGKAHFASSLIHSSKSDHEKSIRSFKQLIKLNPGNFEFVEAISDEYIHLGRLGIAENYISRLISDDPYNLHHLLLLTDIYKLDLNYSAYFNQTLKCLNLNPDENEESLRVTKLTLCFFINFLKQNLRLEESSHNYISRFCVKTLKNIEHIVSKGIVERSYENEYLIALYKYIESHFMAALKMMRFKEKVPEGKRLINFCIKAIGRIMEIYGANYISFWKLLGDILLMSSRLNFKVRVFAWLASEAGCEKEGVEVSCLSGIKLSIKCYATALNLGQSCSPNRLHEFYYDISVALIFLANYPKSVSPELRYLSLKASLQSCLKSFVHSDGFSESRWIHSNLLGIIVSLLGVRENKFKDHFSNQEIKMNEGLMLQNYATHLAKNGLYNHAEETFEQARLRVDMDYSSSWTGQLLMQLLNNDVETKRMLQYNLTQIGSHPLFKWILAYYMTSNRLSLNLHGGQYSVLSFAFSEDECLLETNPSRLTLMAYIHQLIGNLPFAKRLYFRVLRLAKNVNSETYHVFVGNAVRVNPHCMLNFNLIEQLDSEFSPLATFSLFHLSSHHISILNVNKFIFLSTLIVVKNLLNFSSSNEENILVLIVPLLNFLNRTNLSKYMNAKVPFILEYMINNIIGILKCRKKEFKQMLSTMDNACRALFLKNIQKFVSMNKFNQSAGSKCLVLNDTAIHLIKESGSQLSSNTLIRESATENSSNISLGPVNSSVSPGNVISSLQKNKPCCYTNVLADLRRTVFPLPLSDEERLIIKRNKILNQQMSNIPQAEVKKSFKKEESTYPGIVEEHGCHSSCNILFSFLQRSVSIKDYDSSLKYAHLCLDIKCASCFQTTTIVPLISYVSVETKNVRLIQKALHLYPSHPLLRKTTLWFFSSISG